MASPQGIARVGTVLDVKEPEARKLIEGRWAREYEPVRDAKNPHGLVRPPEKFQA